MQVWTALTFLSLEKELLFKLAHSSICVYCSLIPFSIILYPDEKIKKKNFIMCLVPVVYIINICVYDKETRILWNDMCHLNTAFTWIELWHKNVFHSKSHEFDLYFVFQSMLSTSKKKLFFYNLSKNEGPMLFELNKSLLLRKKLTFNFVI